MKLRLLISWPYNREISLVGLALLQGLWEGKTGTDEVWCRMRVGPDVARFVCKGPQEERSPANSLIVAPGGLWPAELEKDKYVLFRVTKFVIIFYSSNEELIQQHVIDAQWEVKTRQKKERMCTRVLFWTGKFHWDKCSLLPVVKQIKIIHKIR